MDWESLRSILVNNKQDHLLSWYDELNDEQRRLLYNDLKLIDFERLRLYYESAQQMLLKSTEKKDEDRLLPLDESMCASTTSSCDHTQQEGGANTLHDSTQIDEWYTTGLEAISKGAVGVLLLAGGQGTRLGVAYPKGMYNVGLPSNKTLYQLQAERIICLQRLAKEKFGNETVIPWYIMTSEYTRETTLKFFEEHSYFGLNSTNVIIFEQNTLPCMDFNGKVLLDQKHRITRSPDGNGGLYNALINPNNNMLKDMKSRGVQCVHVYGVDNILVKMADPVFIGYCRSKGADCGAKVVRKSSPNEKVGVVCLLDGKYQVVEYSEITTNIAEKRKEDGSLLFSAGNICNHYFTVPFLERVCSQHKEELVHHIAKKKVPFINEQGVRVEPTTPNAIKMERFVFDVFRFSETFVVLEVSREDEFAPLKNGVDSLTDSPLTVRQSLMNLHFKYLVKAGGSLIDSNGKPVPLVNGPVRNMICEISPLVTYSGEGLKELCEGKTFNEPLHLK